VSEELLSLRAPLSGVVWAALKTNVCHLLAGLNTDQYAAEMRTQLAA
jgi:hypothetical protein